MKKVLKKKNTTIDDLANMVARGFDGVYKEIGEVKKELGGVKDRLGNVEENLAATRRDVLEIGDRFSLEFASRT